MFFQKAFCLIFLSFLLPILLYGQVNRTALPSTIEAVVIDNLSGSLISNYVFPDTAARMVLQIRKIHAAGGYHQITDLAGFARQLTTDLRAVYGDKHLNVVYQLSLQKGAPYSSYVAEAAKKMKMAEQARQQNYGLSKTEILSGNIGYLALNGFFELSEPSKRAVDGAFDFLINTNALIIDLRLNGGGQADMVKYISNLFFKEPTHINGFYIKRTNELFQTWTEPRPESDIWFAKPIYIIVSGYTASAAEEFAYDMQSLHRAMIIGEVTAGAAHPVQIIDIGNGFSAYIPFARPINPVTKTNWEACGIKPDVVVNANFALDTAIGIFLKQQINSTDTLIVNNARWMYLIYKAKLDPYKMKADGLKRFIGKYGTNKISIIKGHLVYKTVDGYTTGISPMSETTFTLDASLDNRQMIFYKNAKGEPYKMYLNFDGNLSAVSYRNPH